MTIMCTATAAIAFSSIALAHADAILVEVIRVTVDRPLEVSLSPREEDFAAIGENEGVLLSLQDGHWQAPYKIPGAPAEDDESGGRHIPSFYWSMQEGDAVVTNKGLNASRSYRAKDGKAVVPAIPEIEKVLPDASLVKPSGRLREGIMGEIDHEKSITKPIELVAKLDEIGFLNRNGAVTARDLQAANLPKTVHAIGDTSPHGDAILCTMVDSPLSTFVQLNLRTGESTTYPIHGHPKTTISGGIYSPDGDYVLVYFSNVDDDHWPACYLQIFTARGEFMTELEAIEGEWAGLVRLYWLENGWIVYGLGNPSSSHDDKVTLTFCRLDLRAAEEMKGVARP